MRQIVFSAIALILAVVLLTAATPSPAAAMGPAYHIVCPGETLSSIAWKYGLSTWAIANANHLWNPNFIYVGQALVIPFAPQPMHPPVSVPIQGFVPGPACGMRVNYGDTMTGIAWRLRVDPWALARANGIYNLNWIYACQWLRIPNCATPPMFPPHFTY
jgi:hypothetical protein